MPFEEKVYIIILFYSILLYNQNMNKKWIK